MRNKRFAAIVLAVGMVGSLGFTACGGSKDKGVKGEALADEAAWVQAITDTEASINATITFEVSHEAQWGELFMTEAGSGVLEVADGKVHRFMQGRSTGCYEDDGEIISIDEPITIEEYIFERDGVMVEWTKQNGEEWESDCNLHAIVGDTINYYFNVPLAEGLMQAYSQFALDDGTYTYIKETEDINRWIEIKFVDGKLYSYTAETIYKTMEEGSELVRTERTSFVISYGNATIGEFPWEEDSSDGDSSEEGGEVVGSEEGTSEEGGEEIVLPVIEGLEFSINADNASYSVKGTGTYENTEIEIPSMYNGFPVTKVNGYAFSSDQGIEKIVLPNTITSIGYEAFRGCSDLREIIIPASVTYIGSDAFASCNRLEIIQIESLESWCNIHFDDEHANPLCNGASLYLKDEMLTDIVIPSTVASISSYAFYNYKWLTKVTISAGVETIGFGAFYNCLNLAEVVIPDGLVEIRGSAFLLCKALTEIVIPDSVNSVGEKAFYFCDNLKIYCEAETKPSGWNLNWNKSERPVTWGYKTAE